MKKDLLITGVSVDDYKKKAKDILKKEVLPQVNEYKNRQHNNTLRKTSTVVVNNAC